MKKIRLIDEKTFDSKGNIRSRKKTAEIEVSKGEKFPPKQAAILQKIIEEPLTIESPVQIAGN